MLSPAEAARQAGISRQSLMKALAKGRLSATKDAGGRWQIDPAELFRVYPPPSTEAAPTAADSLQRENELLRSMLEDVKADRDRWRETATRLLPPARKGFWARVFGK